MNFWNVVYRFTWVTLIVLLLTGMLCMFVPQYNQYKAYQRHEAELRERIRLEEEMLHALKQKQERFREDPRYLERIAHEMGLARPDETLFKFPDTPEALPETAP